MTILGLHGLVRARRRRLVLGRVLLQDLTWEHHAAPEVRMGEVGTSGWITCCT